MESRILGVLLSVVAAPTAAAQSPAPAAAFPVSIDVDAGHSKSELRRIWRFFGADEPNYAYMKDGRKLLGQLGELAPGEVFFRAR